MQYIIFHPIYNIESNALLIFLTNDPYGRGGLTLNGAMGGLTLNGAMGGIINQVIKIQLPNVFDTKIHINCSYMQPVLSLKGQRVISGDLAKSGVEAIT